MAKNFKDYLTENNVMLQEMTIELMIDKCIKEGKNKSGALSFAKDQEYPVQVTDIIRRLPASMFECLNSESVVADNITFSSLMEDYDGDVTQIIDDYLEEGKTDKEDDEDETDNDENNDDEGDDEDDDKSTDDDEDEKDKKNKKVGGKKKEMDETDDSDDIGTKADSTADKKVSGKKKELDETDDSDDIGTPADSTAKKKADKEEKKK